MIYEYILFSMITNSYFNISYRFCVNTSSLHTWVKNDNDKTKE